MYTNRNFDRLKINKSNNSNNINLSVLDHIKYVACKQWEGDRCNGMKQVVLGRSNLHTFFALFNNIVPLALTTVNYVPWLKLLHYLPWLLWLMCPTTGPIDAQGFNCHRRMVWLPWGTNLTPHGPTFIGARLHPPQKFEIPPLCDGYSYGIIMTASMSPSVS
jgi:hypothetical protein